MLRKGGNELARNALKNMGRVTEDLIKNAKGGMKYSKNKLRWTKFPFDAAEKAMLIMDYGAKKYEWDNWRSVDVELYFDALIRHLIAHLNGEIYDKESGFTHLDHMLCNALFIVWKEECENVS